MQSHQDLLELARPYCDPLTGEVKHRVPEDLMKELRAAKLARGVPRCRNQNTQTFATWFVFLTDEIRDRVLRQVREANQKRPRSRKPASDSSKTPSEQPTDTTAEPSPTPPSSKPRAGNRPPPEGKVPVKRGLGDFRRERRPSR